MSMKNDNFNDKYNKSTPPSKIKVRNPFDKALIERLHKPLCSPGMCKIYKKKNKGSFRWEIDQTCTLVPADIVVCSSQFEPSPDPALEKIAEEATEKFFSQEVVVPSPLESSKKIKPLLLSFDDSIQVKSVESGCSKVTKEVSVQTMLTLPPTLPPEIEKILEPFCNFTEEYNMFEEYEVTANGSLRRKLLFEEQSDHYDSEQTDDEIHIEQRPLSNCEAHTPVVFSPDELSRDVVSRGMKRTFGTPLHNRQSRTKPKNKILDVVDFGEPCFSPIAFHTPKRCPESTTSSSLASSSISPLTKVVSSDEEKNNLTSPECEDMATCLDCFVSDNTSEKKGKCFCKHAPNKSLLMRSTSLKESPHKNKRGFLLMEKRSLSMSSLHRSRSVQKLDFSMDMSIDGSMRNSFHADSESSLVGKTPATWPLEEDSTIQNLVKLESLKNKSDVQSSTKIHTIHVLDETPIKGSKGNNILTHEISKIRSTAVRSPERMSLDSSLDNFDIPAMMEDRKIDFNKIDLKFLTENVSQVDHSSNYTKVTSDTSTSFKRVDSGFTENTLYVNASSYYESAIKPSELTVTNVSKGETKTALREISNINWMRVDSGFKDESSADSMLFYPESSMKKVNINEFQDKENIEDFDRFLHAPGKGETMSMSDIFTDDLTFNCNFSSTPSKNKNRNANS